MDKTADFTKSVKLPIEFARVALIVPAGNGEFQIALPTGKFRLYSDGASMVRANIFLGDSSAILSEYRLKSISGSTIASCRISQNSVILREINAGRGLPISGDEPRWIVEQLKRHAIQAEQAYRQMPQGAPLPNRPNGNYGAALLVLSVAMLAGATGLEAFVPGA